MKIEYLTIQENRRILVTSDIHGHLSLLKELLKRADFSEDDLLFIVGDLVEKGPESLKTIQYVMELCDTGRVTVLLGNVDLWRLQMFEDLNNDNSHDFYRYLESMRKWKGTSLYDEMAAELGIALDCPEKTVAVKGMMQERFKREFDFLYSLPAVVETQNYIFVHSGLPGPEVEEDLEVLKDRSIYDVLKCDHFMSLGFSFRKYVVVGHWPVSLYDSKVSRTNPIINREQHIISIDGGCGLNEAGQLNMLIIPDINCGVEKLHFVSCDDFDVYAALTAQEESKESIHICWVDNRIRILRRGEDFSDVEHISTGYRLRMYNRYIDDLHAPSGETWCEDYTDYMLPVKPGDRLSLVCGTSEGYLMKKDGVTGWYTGKLRKAAD